MVGIYYLCDGPRVLYVGASRNIEKRIADHRRRGDILFDNSSFDECGESELRDRECAAIRELRPILNEQNVLRHDTFDNSGHIKSKRKRLIARRLAKRDSAL